MINIAIWIWVRPLPIPSDQYHHHRAGSWLRRGMTAVPRLSSSSIRERSKPSQPFYQHYHDTMITMQSQRSRNHPNHKVAIHIFFDLTIWHFRHRTSIRSWLSSISGDPLQHCLPWWEWRLHQECKLRVFSLLNLILWLSTRWGCSWLRCLTSPAQEASLHSDMASSLPLPLPFNTITITIWYHYHCHLISLPLSFNIITIAI